MLIYADKVFENLIEVIEAFCPNQVKPALDKVEFLKNKGLYLVGDGSVIPADTPVIIMSDAAAVALTKIDATTAAAESGNILRGTAVETLRTGLITGSEKVYVLGRIGEVFGFYEYTGDEIPANKAYYVE